MTLLLSTKLSLLQRNAASNTNLMLQCMCRNVVPFTERMMHCKPIGKIMQIQRTPFRYSQSLKLFGLRSLGSKAGRNPASERRDAYGKKIVQSERAQWAASGTDNERGTYRQRTNTSRMYHDRDKDYQNYRIEGTSKKISKDKKIVSKDSSSIHKNYSLEDLEKSPFHSLGISNQLVKRLKENIGITEPVEIQSLSLRPIKMYRNVVIQSETGSGKTLAYLLPIIQQAKFICNTVIVVPSRELAYQIYLEARKLTTNADIACYVSRPDNEMEFEKLKAKPPKIVIGTPKQLLSVVRDHEYLFSNIRRVVLDEVDKLIPQIPLGMRRLIKKREKNPKPLTLLLAVLQGISKNKLQHIACSATITEQMIGNLKDLGWGEQLKVIKSEKYDEKSVVVPGKIKHNYVLVQDSSMDSKVAALSRIFTRNGSKPTLVFVHRDHSINNYVTEMRNLNLNAVAFYKEVVSGKVEDVRRFLEKFRSGEISVVVSSEETVRGLDFKDLGHVFLFSVPRCAEEYLHIAGRVGRLGKDGLVTTVIDEAHENGIERLHGIYRELGITGSEINV